ncbi:MAG TPA: hypothetical protein VEJ44_03455 [Acidimicrobiales bacterium]|nr:hypothetical protein [Acidimicrobiales bacterium]
MYLFTRRARLGTEKLAEAMQWAVTITEKVNQVSVTPFSLYSTIFSPEVGTLSWSTVVESLSELEATDAKLMADGGYLDLVSEGAKYQAAGSIIDDTLASFVLADRSESGSPAYANLVRATLAPGALASGIETGVEIAQKAKAIGGLPVSFLVGSTGPYGGVGWITSADSIDELQAAAEKVNASADFLRLLDTKGSEAYLPGSATQVVVRKIV